MGVKIRVSSAYLVFQKGSSIFGTKVGKSRPISTVRIFTIGALHIQLGVSTIPMLEDTALYELTLEFKLGVSKWLAGWIWPTGLLMDHQKLGSIVKGVTWHRIQST